MSLLQDRSSSPLKRNITIIYVGVIFLFLTILLLAMFTNIFKTSEEGQVPDRIWLLLVGALLVAVFLLFSKASKILDAVENNSVKLERIAEAFEKNRSVLTQIEENGRLSETAKTIIFRHEDCQALRELVLEELQLGDFQAANATIDEISRRPEYASLAENLRRETHNYTNASDQQRTDQVIAHIREFFDNYQWASASSQIERLIKDCPDSQEAKLLRQELLDKKNDRKKELLNAWDEAVKEQLTDRSIEILKQLDLYLTPNEGLALQEAAKDIFKNKLHSLGVRFSLAVSENNWAEAMRTGQQIIKDFPNSKIAEEIREKREALEKRIEQQAGE